MSKQELMTIVVAEDDPDDRLMIERGWQTNNVANPLRFVKDGEELMDYLLRRGEYADPTIAPRPGLILLDLNMPRKDGREVLREIKADPGLRRIPVIVLTTSSANQDILATYETGANSFITKPVAFEKFCQMLRCLEDYWVQIVHLPMDVSGDENAALAATTADY